MTVKWVKGAGITLGAVAVSALLSGGASAQGLDTKVGAFDLSVGGYVRNYTSVNLQDPQEVKGDDSGSISMFRNSLRVDGSARSPWVNFFLSGRGSYEYKTSYLAKLNRAGAGQNTGGLMRNYDEIALREAHADFDLGERLSFRIGRQQIVWGELDFFRGTDIVSGFDYTWRSFLEVENEELRKPLDLITAWFKIPELEGQIQGFIRPGIDAGTSIGNTYDLFGGRWANQPNKGTDFFNANNVKYDYHHPSGDISDVTGGVRFSGTLNNNLNYSVLYLRTFNNNPVLNPSPSVGGTAYQKNPTTTLGDLIYPEVDVYGATASYQVEPIDTVFALEIAATHGSAWNRGSINATNGLAGIIDSTTGVVRKTSVTTMVRADHNLNLQNLIGTSKPSFFTFSVFDTWLPDWKESDQLIDLVGYSAKRSNHDFIATVILAMNYSNDTINPGIAAGVDMTYGGGFFIPSIEWVVGNHLRVKAEADIFFVPGQTNSGDSGPKRANTHLFGYFDNNDQFLVRTTYQF